jgi:hypothetical protein
MPSEQEIWAAVTRFIDAAMGSISRSEYAAAESALNAATRTLPPLENPVPSHQHIYETYYEIDIGEPLPALEILHSRHQMATILLNQGKNAASRIRVRAEGASVFYPWYESYCEKMARDPKRIVQHGYRCWSASNDDGLIAEIFKRIGTDNQFFIEFGMQDGVQSNSTALLFSGWSGLRIEASQPYHTLCDLHFATFVKAGKLKNVHRFLTAENIDGVLSQNCPYQEPDLLSIDVNGNDYWLWQAVTSLKPRVVIVEYNCNIHPPISIVQPYIPTRIFNGTSYYGASLEAIAKLSRRKGYSLVGCSLIGDNAYFVRNDLLQDKFHQPGNVMAHFEPTRVMNFPLSHMPGFGPFEIIN